MSPPFTGSPLKASKNYCKQGSKHEREVCAFFHDQESVPVLISAALLRQKGLGQVDGAWLNKEILYLAECKTGQGRLSFRQKRRLLGAALYLCQVFDVKTKLVKITPVAKKRDGHYPLNVEIIKELNA